MWFLQVDGYCLVPSVHYVRMFDSTVRLWQEKLARNAGKLSHFHHKLAFDLFFAGAANPFQNLGHEIKRYLFLQPWKRIPFQSRVVFNKSDLRPNFSPANKSMMLHRQGNAPIEVPSIEASRRSYRSGAMERLGKAPGVFHQARRSTARRLRQGIIHDMPRHLVRKTTQAGRRGVEQV